MKIVVSQESLEKALTTSTRPILTKANLPILSNLLITAEKNNLEIVSTNLETATKIILSCKVDVAGKTTVSGRQLFEFISQLPGGDLTIEKLGEEFVVESGSFSARFATMSTDEFPTIPKVESGLNIELSTADFAGAISKVAFCAAQDEGRPILTGVLCEFGKNKLVMVATDGYRLSYKEIKFEKAQTLPAVKIVIPAKALLELEKILGEKWNGEEDNKTTFKLSVSEDLNQANFKLGKIEFTSRLIEGEFPNWQKIIPSSFPTKVKVLKEDLLRLVKIASIFARDAGNIVRLKFENEGKKARLSVIAKAREVGSSDAKCDIEMTGPGGEIAFNFRYILEVLTTIDSDDIYFEMIESLNPGRFSSFDDKESFFHIIMPVRLQG